MRAASLSRRNLLSGELRQRPAPLRPPWTDERSILDACTGCGACIDACPQAILFPDGRGRPAVSFAESECTFCGACAEACPEPVFAPQETRPFAQAAEIGGACLAMGGVHCQTCGDRCPDAAIRFRPRLGGPPLPELDKGACTSCGACAAACPADAISIRPPEAAHG